MDGLSYCSCGQGTQKVDYERDLVSGSEVCKACAKHDKGLEKYGSAVDVLQYRYPEDRMFVSDMFNARVKSVPDAVVRYGSVLYYGIHNLVMSDAPVVRYSLKRGSGDFQTPPKKRLPSNLRKAYIRPYRRAYKYAVKARPYRRKRIGARRPRRKVSRRYK